MKNPGFLPYEKEKTARKEVWDLRESASRPSRK